MPTTFWTGNAAAIAKIVTIQVTAVAGGAVLSVTFPNGKAISYTCGGGDTTTTAAAALQALLAASTAPPEFQEITWTVDTTTITATSKLAGRWFSFTAAGSGGGTVVQTTTTENSGPSDINLANNWLRSGSPSTPQNGDDVVIANSIVPMLYNLDAFAARAFASVKRYQSMTGQIGLLDQNPSGYREYRATSFQFIGSVAPLPVTIGLGPGSGPSTFERYNTLTQETSWSVLGSTLCRILNTSAASSFQINGPAIVHIATLPGETSTCTGGVEATNGSQVSIGSGVTFAGTLRAYSSSVIFCETVPTQIISNGSQVSVNATGGTCTSLSAVNSSTITWRSSAAIGTLTLATSSRFDKTYDNRNIVITSSVIDGNCQIVDPWNTITYTNATTINGVVSSGPFTFGPGRSIHVT